MSGDPASGLQHQKPAPSQVSTHEDAVELTARRRGDRIRNITVLLLVGILWGIQPALIKASTDQGLFEIEALALVMIIVSGLLGAMLAARRRLFRPTAGKLKFMTLSGTAEYAAPLLAAFLVAPHVDAGLLTLIMATTPIFTVILAAMLGDDPLNRYSILACAAGILAMMLIVLPANALPSPDMLPWCLAAFSIPIIYSCGTIYVSRAWPKDMDAMQVAFGGALMAGLMLAPFWILPAVSGRFPATTATALLAFAALALAVVLEMVLYFYLLKHAGPVFTSFSSFVMILSGFIAGAVFFDERQSIWIWASVALFSLSLALVLMAPHARSRLEHDTADDTWARNK